MKGLIIKPNWADLILSGKKTWEIRGSNTKIRGTIALIKSGTGMIFGTAVLTKSFHVTQTALDQGFRNHRIPETVEITYEKPHVWELTAVKRFEEPIPYTHPKGAVIWVNLPDELF
ncbi:ASCH domain-containing protein [Cohnella abietis]|uniref:ASCH domain-containing protein n=1 Tax=Cohnella abietis TaxID=2507935 RepID=A0A3T1D335_9BACL|nr:ASCH domain-containing protein [Cohnella abietis]BBI32461.1 hypothetical protein KCTCHS21_18600 [Cohnella abietis]